ncbi:MAG: DUF309 domain-containing protein [Thermoplasmata archaeon]
MPGTPSEEEREARLGRALRDGVDLYNAGRFFESHEVLEDVWLEEEGDDRAFLQGIIKLAAAFHHYGKGTYQGMWNLLRAGSRMLQPFRPAYRGVELAHFLTQIETWIPRAQRLLAGEDVEIRDPVPPLVYRPPGRARSPPEE